MISGGDLAEILIGDGDDGVEERRLRSPRLLWFSFEVIGGVCYCLLRFSEKAAGLKKPHRAVKGFLISHHFRSQIKSSTL